MDLEKMVALCLFADLYNSALCCIIIMVALWNRADHYIFILFLSFFFLLFISSPNLSGRRLDVYHTSILPHMVWP